MQIVKHLVLPMIKGVLLDLSGVLYLGDQAIEGSVAALIRLQSTGLPILYVTNTTRQSRHQIWLQLQTMQFPIQEKDIFTAPMAAHAYLSRQNLSPYLLIHPLLKPDFADLITEKPDAVLVGDAAEDFSYPHMNTAFRYLIDGAPLVAMGKNRYFMEQDGLSLDSGTYVAALEYAAGVDAVITGKPAIEFYTTAVKAIDCTAQSVVMVGDDVDADVNGAIDAGLTGVLVQTGKYRLQDNHRLTQKDTPVVKDFSAAVEWIISQL